MRGFFSRLWFSGVVGTFLTGAFFLLPIVLTFFIISYVANWLRSFVGPGTFLGDLVTTSGSQFFGITNQNLAFWLGLALVLSAIWALGAVITLLAKRRLEDAFDGLLNRVPLVRSVYNPVARMVRLMGGGSSDLEGMQVISCRFGGEMGADILALLTSQETFNINGEKRKLVYIPTSPVPMSGGLLLVPERSIQIMNDLDIDGLMKIYLSLGALAPDSMPQQFIWPDPSPANARVVNPSEIDPKLV